MDFYWLWKDNRVQLQVVAQPTRWSPIVIWVFVGQSSSWPWEPHIGGCKLLKPVLRTQLAGFDTVFCKMYLLYRSCPRRKSFSSNFCLFPSQNDCFLQPLEGTWQLSWFGVHSGGTPNWDYCKILIWCSVSVFSLKWLEKTVILGGEKAKNWAETFSPWTWPI